MNTGDVVKRSDRYKWCICERRRRCMCRDGTFTVKAVNTAMVCQSGAMVKVAKNTAIIDWCDSSYFVKV